MWRRLFSSMAKKSSSYSSSIQDLYDLCKTTFTILDLLLKLYTKFVLYWMCMFCFPTSSVIPLHDHPGMTVTSKVLYGSLHVKAYDWIEPRYLESRGNARSPVRLEKLAVDKVLTSPCVPSILYPNSGGNLHCFTAVTPCVVLDILAPPYQEDAGRKCTYYHDYPYSSFSATGKKDEIVGENEEYAWLAEITTPEDLYMGQGRYTGPSIRT